MKENKSYISRTKTSLGLKNDLDLVKKCVSKFPWAIEYVGNQCINNKDLIQCATKNVKWVARFIKKYAES